MSLRDNMLEEYLGKFGNQVLYDMCAARPDHTDPDIIFSKIWLIGRTYSVPLERKAGDPDVLRKVSNSLATGELDQIISSVDCVDRINSKNLKSVVEAHSRFNYLLKQLTSLNRPSFASKYLHFHRPKAFFILDSVADRNVRAKLKNMRFSIPGEWEIVDRRYAAFCLRAMEFRDSHAPEADPRGLDQMLYPYSLK